MNHKAMFTAGAVLSGCGLLAIGAAIGGAAEAASYQTTAITYLAPLGNGFDGCGLSVNGGEATNAVRRIKNYKGQESVVICQMTARIPK